jgi:hypothetical protein
MLLRLTAQSETSQPAPQPPSNGIAQPPPLHAAPFRLGKDIVPSLRAQPIEEWSDRREPPWAAGQAPNSLLEQRVNPLPIVESFAKMRGDDANAAFVLETLLVPRLK